MEGCKILPFTVKRRYSKVFTIYIKMTYIYLLSQTKEGMKSVCFSLVRGISHGSNMGGPSYKSVDVKGKILRMKQEFYKIKRSD